MEYEDNLRFFLEFGVAPGDGCDYLLVVQQVLGGWDCGAEDGWEGWAALCDVWGWGC